MPPDAPSARIQSLHGLRGVMAWWVVLGHVSLALDWRLPWVERNGLAVDVFILLSGFVIALLLERGLEAYPAYLVRRAFRLFPLYLPVLALSAWLLPVQLAAWDAAAPSLANLHRAALAREALADPLWHLAAHIPLAQGLVPKALGGNVAYTIVGQAWSISLEWQFYIVAPALVAAMAMRRWWRAGAMVLVLVALAPLFTTAFLGAKIALFLIGIATRMAMTDRDRRAALMICVLGATVALAWSGPMLLVPLAIWAAVILSARQSPDRLAGRLARSLEGRLACHMGDISYAIYLVHMVPLFVSIHLFDRMGWNGTDAQSAIAIGTLAATYAGALACHHAIEKPGIRAGAWLAGRMRPRSG